MELPLHLPWCRAWLVACVAALGAGAPGPASAGDIEVFHAWDKGAAAAATALLKSEVAAKGHLWGDFTVVNGGSGMSATILRSRILFGNPPSAAQLALPVIQQWAREGALADLDALAKAEHWDAKLPNEIIDSLKYKGRYVAVPLSLHRTNWLWINANVLKRAGARAPTSWDEFFATAEAMRQAGFIAVAHGGQPWQNQLLFENVALGVGGPQFYRKAFLALDAAELAGPMMEQALRTFRRIKPYTDQNADASARGLDLTTMSLVRGEAGMYFMGDWAKPVMLAAQQSSNFKFLCVPAPGLPAYSYALDAFAMFKVTAPAQQKAQLDFSSVLLSEKVQQSFSLTKGSLPVRLGMSLDKFDACAKQSGAAFEAAVRDDALVPSFATATEPVIEEAIRTVINDFWNDERITPEAAITRLIAAVRRPIAPH
jgi:glucose/mannose transport system substrate-binding protein